MNLFGFLKPKESFKVNGWEYTYRPVEGGIGLMITDLSGRPLGKPELISRPRNTGRRRSGWNWFTHG